MKLKKVIIFIVVLLLLLNSVCFGTIGTIDTDYYEPPALEGNDYVKAFNMAKTIVTVITTVGIVIAIVALLVIGIKYMVGSVEQKAEYKKTMIPYILGCIFIFATSTIVSVIYNIVTQM